MKKQIIYFGLLILLLPTMAVAQNTAQDCINLFDDILDGSGVPPNNVSYTDLRNAEVVGISRCIGGGEPEVSVQDSGTLGILFRARYEGSIKSCVITIEPVGSADPFPESQMLPIKGKQGSLWKKFLKSDSIEAGNEGGCTRVLEYGDFDNAQG